MVSSEEWRWLLRAVLPCTKGARPLYTSSTCHRIWAAPHGACDLGSGGRLWQKAVPRDAPAPSTSNIWEKDCFILERVHPPHTLVGFPCEFEAGVDCHHLGTTATGGSCFTLGSSVTGPRNKAGPFNLLMGQERGHKWTRSCRTRCESRGETRSGITTASGHLMCPLGTSVLQSSVVMAAVPPFSSLLKVLSSRKENLIGLV